MSVNPRRFTFTNRHEASECQRHAGMFGIPSSLEGPIVVADWGEDGRDERWTVTLDPAALETDAAA